MGPGIAIVLAAVWSALASPTDLPEAPDFETASREAVRLLQDYLRVDTSNPPAPKARPRNGAVRHSHADGRRAQDDLWDPAWRYRAGSQGLPLRKR